MDESSTYDPDMPLNLRFVPLGDQIRFFVREVMKHATENVELASIGLALNMLATDVDGMPQR